MAESDLAVTHYRRRKRLSTFFGCEFHFTGKNKHERLFMSYSETQLHSGGDVATLDGVESLKDVKKSINVGVPAQTHKAIADYCDDRSLIMRDTVGKVLAWFLEQPRPVQRAVLGDIDGEVATAYADVLAKMAEGLRGEPAVPPRIAHIKGGKVIHPKGEGFPDRR